MALYETLFESAHWLLLRCDDAGWHYLTCTKHHLWHKERLTPASAFSFFCVTSHHLSAASVVCPLPPAVHTSPSAFNARLSGLLCGWPVSLELVTWQCSCSDTFIWQFLTRFKTFLFSAYCDYSTAEALRLCAIWIHDWNWHWHLLQSYFRFRKRLGITRAVFYN